MLAFSSRRNTSKTSFKVFLGASSNRSRTHTMRAESPRGVISISAYYFRKRSFRSSRARPANQDADRDGSEPSGETASATFSTCSLISPTCGCTSRIKSCSACEICSIRVVISWSSFSIASWREEMRRIHQKQTHQQPRPTHVSTKRVMSLHTRGFDLDVDRHRLADSRNRFSALVEHQIEIAAFERLGCHRPMGFFDIIRDRAN